MSRCRCSYSGPRRRSGPAQPALDQAADQRGGHVATADEGQLANIVHPSLPVSVYRAPNKAVPMRTCVAPSAMAASKSALIPIDSVSS
jgi:hypothetical protein